MDPSCGAPAIEVDGLRMRYGETDVLRDVSFSVPPGQLVALLGPNGAGKSTTIEVLEGFRMRSAGRVAVLGVDPAHGDERWRARLGIVLQSWRDHGKWRVRELLSLQGAYYTPYSTAAHLRPWDTDALLASVGLTEHADRQIRVLSGGQRRRLDVAIGLVGRPELLFLDEPTAGLDPEARRDFHSLLREIADERETTIVLATHDLAEAERLAGRILIIDRGRIIADGTPTELARQVVGEDEVRWTRDGERFSATTPDATTLARTLFSQYGETIRDLEIDRASLEDSYMTLVRQAEAATTR